MNAWSRGKKGYKSIYVPTRHGGLVQRSTGTNVPAIVRGMKRMASDLRDRSTASGNWTLLDAIYAKKLTLKALYPVYVSNGLAALEARLSAANLSEHLTAWIEWVRANRHEDVRTADVYWQQVTTLVKPDEAFPASELTKARALAWLTSRSATSSGTKRKYLYALKSFVRYLLDAGVLATDPLAGLKAPKKDRARERWEPATVDERIVQAASPKYRAFFAFIKGTGCDVGSAHRSMYGDVYKGWARVDIRGTKTDRRAVHQATVEPWARPYLEAHTAHLLGNTTRVFPGITNSGASHHHDRCCEAVGVENYTLKDARHSVAVRMRKAGKSFEDIAGQLGTSVFQAVTVYSKYKPDEQAEQQREAK